MNLDVYELLNNEALNEHEKFTIFKERLEDYCTKEDKVLKIFKILKGIEMELKASLGNTELINVKKSTVEKLIRIIEIEIRIIRYKIKHPELMKERISGKFPVGQWTDNKADLIELIYAISLIHSVEHGKASIKAIKEGFEYIFGIDLGNIHDRLDDIVGRQEPRARYLGKLVECLNKFLYSLDAR